MPDLNTDNIHAASFRDPSGFVFKRGVVLYRQVNIAYRRNYDLLLSSGLYEELCASGDLIPHEEVSVAPLVVDTAYKVLLPRQVPFISYPSEWTFGQLKDAALLTLRVQGAALKRGMILKDASAFNVQFVDGRPILIDTLSFEQRSENLPWIAYKQFCEHFLGPLALRSMVDGRLGHLQTSWIDGVPLDVVTKILPWKARLRPGLFLHLFMHGASQKRFTETEVRRTRPHVTMAAQLGMVDSLEATVKGLKYSLPRGGWSSYYDTCTYSEVTLKEKKEFVSLCLDQAGPKLIWDLGANTGAFSMIAAQRGALAIAVDSDAASVERLYLDCRARSERNILPLIVDLTNPTPSIGWANEERASFLQRGPVDMVFALALVHHLAIANNLPLDRIAAQFAVLCRHLVVEFVPKDDPQTQRLLRSRQDIFDRYTRQEFDESFKRYFRILSSRTLSDSNRTLYFMESSALHQARKGKT